MRSEVRPFYTFTDTGLQIYRTAAARIIEEETVGGEEYWEAVELWEKMDKERELRETLNELRGLNPNGIVT